MKLKEQFSKARLYTQFDSGIKFEIECEKIAESFAINFANWYEFMLRHSDNLNSRFTPKELIEIFKKEKRL